MSVYAALPHTHTNSNGNELNRVHANISVNKALIICVYADMKRNATLIFQ